MLSSKGLKYFPKKLNSKVINEIESIWNSNRQPCVVSELDKNEINNIFIQSPKIIDMPIKIPRTQEYRIPKNFLHLFSIIKKIADIETSINPHTDNYFAYLSINSLNNIDKNLPITHTYMFYNNFINKTKDPFKIKLFNSYNIDELPTSNIVKITFTQKKKIGNTQNPMFS